MRAVKAGGRLNDETCQVLSAALLLALIIVVLVLAVAASLGFLIGASQLV
jgi:hypothetical protein